MSSTISAMSTGLQGIQKGMAGLRKNAQDVASQNNAPQSLESSLVDMKANELQVQISAKVVQTSTRRVQ